MNKSKASKQTVLIATIIVAVILLIGGATFFGKKSSAGNNWYIVGKSDVSQDVHISAEVKPAQNVDLAFARTGIIGNVAVAVGDTVKKGAVLAELGNADISAQIAQATANLATEKAKQAALLKGARPEDTAVTEASLAAASTAASEASGILLDKTRDSFTTADDALHNLASPMFSNPDTPNPKLTFQTSDSKASIAIEAERVAVGVKLSAWQSERANSTNEDPDSYAIAVESNLREEINFYDMLAAALSLALNDSSNTNTVLAAYRASVTLGRSNLNTALSSVISTKQAYENAKASALVVDKQLTLKKAGATSEDLEAESARVASAEAALESAQAELGKTVIVAPFSGVVTRVDAKRGASAPTNVALITMISANSFQIEGYVSEVDVPNVQKEAIAQVTLDAFGTGKTFAAHVVSIDPAPTMINGIGAYKAIIELNPGIDPGVKSGMHANVTIMAASKKSVVTIPPQALISRVGKEYVELENSDGTTHLLPIVTGLKGNMIEVTSGLVGGEKINSFGDITNINQ